VIDSASESNRGGVDAPSGDVPGCVGRGSAFICDPYKTLYSPLHVEAECDQDSGSDGESDADQT
jgi:hypothetical protein